MEGIVVLFSYNLCVYWLQLTFSSQWNWYPAEVRPWYKYADILRQTLTTAASFGILCVEYTLRKL